MSKLFHLRKIKSSYYFNLFISINGKYKKMIPIFFMYFIIQIK